jgi:hypothetical protein
MKKNKNQILFLIFIGLIALFVLTKVFRSPARETNLETDLFGIDTAEISSIRLVGNSNGDLTLKKENSDWMVTHDSKAAKADRPAVDNLLRTLSRLKPERIVSRKKEKWDTYNVGDSSSLHVTAFDGDNEELINWHVGKESQGMTYLRPAEDDEVYAMEGLLRRSLDKDFSGWRDKTFLRLKAADVVGISFKYPLDSGFVMRKDGNRWIIDDHQADSAAVQRYINKLQSRNISNVLDDYAPASVPDVTVTIERTGGEPAVIKAWRDPEDSWTLNSTFQQEAYFRDAGMGKDLFVGKKSLIKD